MLRTSEFWLAIAAAIGSAFAGLGWITKEDWQTYVAPAIVYVVGRVTSKAVKNV